MALINSGLEAKDVERQTGIPESTVYSIKYYNKELSVLTPAKNPIDAIIADRKRIGRAWGPGRYVVIADLHILFHNKQIIEQLLALPGDFDGCIIAGDYLDEYWISFFRKEGPRITHSKEVAAGIGIIEMLTKRFGRVLYIQGNHEDRRWKQILEATKAVADLMEEESPEVYAVVEKARNWYFNKLPNITVHNNWWVDICNGKIIISHPDRFMKVPGQAPAGVLEHFMGHAKAYGLNMPIDGVFMGHTHRMSGPTHRLGIWTAELPCMCGVLPYQVSSKAGNAGTVDTGFYVMTTRKNGELWFNESRVYLLETDEKAAKIQQEEREGTFKLLK
jgi:predicted phosphodiesterase